MHARYARFVSEVAFVRRIESARHHSVRSEPSSLPNTTIEYFLYEEKKLPL